MVERSMWQLHLGRGSKRKGKNWNVKEGSTYRWRWRKLIADVICCSSWWRTSGSSTMICSSNRRIVVGPAFCKDPMVYEGSLSSFYKKRSMNRVRPVLQTHWTSGRNPSPGMYTPMPKTWGGLPGAPAHTQGPSTKSDQADTVPNIQSAHAVRRLVHLDVCTYSQQPRHLEDRSQLWWSSVDAFRLGDPVPMCHKRHIPGDNVDQAMQFTGWESQNWILFPSICLKAT